MRAFTARGPPRERAILGVRKSTRRSPPSNPARAVSGAMPPARISASTSAPAPRRSCGRTNTATQPSAINSDVMSQRGAGRQMSRARLPADDRPGGPQEAPSIDWVSGHGFRRCSRATGILPPDSRGDAVPARPGPDPGNPGEGRSPCRPFVAGGEVSMSAAAAARRAHHRPMVTGPGRLPVLRRVSCISRVSNLPAGQGH